MYDFKGAIGKGWGCFQCGLPMDGASAVLCDPCLDQLTSEKREPKFIVSGWAMENHREPFPPEERRIQHRHDMQLHPEAA